MADRKAGTVSRSPLLSGKSRGPNVAAGRLPLGDGGLLGLDRLRMADQAVCAFPGERVLADAEHGGHLLPLSCRTTEVATAWDNWIGISWPSCDQRAFLVSPTKTQSSGRP